LLIEEFSEVGKIPLDLEGLRPYIKLTKGGRKGQDRYIVDVLVQVSVIDRDLKVTVRWPDNDKGNIVPGSQKSYSIVAAFGPGTN